MPPSHTAPGAGVMPVDEPPDNSASSKNFVSVAETNTLTAQRILHTAPTSQHERHVRQQPPLVVQPSYLLVWGSGEHGQNATETQCDVEPAAAAPLTLSAPKSVACGSSHTCIVTHSGEIFAWGNGTSGQLGNGEAASTHVPVRVLISRPSDESAVVGLACGNRFTVVWTAAGNCYGFGSNYNAQLGYNFSETEFKRSPVIPRAISVCSRPVRSVACGSKHSVFVIDDGSVYSCGGGGEGQLGHGTRADEACPRKITSLEGVLVTQVACGTAHTVALCSAGTMYIWGSRVACGQSGDAMTPTPLAGLAEGACLRVACGGTHSLAIAEGGVVYSWGRGQHGQLGHGKDVINVPRPRAIAALKGARVASIGAGEWFSVALSCDGASAHIWGRNTNNVVCAEEGRVGESRLCVWEPMVCEAPKGMLYADVACGGWHAAAILRPRPAPTLKHSSPAAKGAASVALASAADPQSEKQRRIAYYRAVMDEPLIASIPKKAATQQQSTEVSPANATPLTSILKTTLIVTNELGLADCPPGNVAVGNPATDSPGPSASGAAEAVVGTGDKPGLTRRLSSGIARPPTPPRPPSATGARPQSSQSTRSSSGRLSSASGSAISSTAGANAVGARVAHSDRGVLRTASSSPHSDAASLSLSGHAITICGGEDDQRGPAPKVRFSTEDSASASAMNGASSAAAVAAVSMTTTADVPRAEYQPSGRLLHKRSQTARPKSAHPSSPLAADAAERNNAHDDADRAQGDTPAVAGVSSPPGGRLLQRPKSARPRLHATTDGDAGGNHPAILVAADETPKRVKLQSRLEGVRRLYSKPSVAQEKLLKLLHKFDGDGDGDGDDDLAAIGGDLCDFPDTPIGPITPQPNLEKKSSRTNL